MPWESRGGREYYYRKVRRGGRVFSVYEGGGLLGRAAAERAAVKRETEAEARTRLRIETAAQDRIDALLDRSAAVAEGAARAALSAAGYHLHKRQWRLKRDGTAKD